MIQILSLMAAVNYSKLYPRVIFYAVLVCNNSGILKTVWVLIIFGF